MQGRAANRLAKEKSPYLLQHAHNPVDWFPWGDEAFERAKQENKPVFLSIGYSTCHWCHVMERECFEDQEVADLLNKHFVSVKVDREERPDIDQVYMASCQALTGSGGWPLTVIATWDGKPFVAGTYFPKHSTRGYIGLIELLCLIQEKWEHQREQLVSMSEQLTQVIESAVSPLGSSTLGENEAHLAYRSLQKSFDPQYGGFGVAPKFPTASNLLFLLRYWKWTDEPDALRMLESTLRAMSRGGIFDHIGFGFSRYSVDRRWLVPHFEKMLYDNALLALAYTEAFQATAHHEFLDVAEKVLRYVLRDMTSPEGGFYSAEDADSEGVEGKFYVWTREEISEVVDADKADLFCHFYDISEEGNFEGKNIPNRIGIPEPSSSEQQVLEEVREALFRHRSSRIRPHLDDKILTSWNALTICALARAYRVTGNDEYETAATRCIRFIRSHLSDDRQRLLARHRAGEAAYPAYLDDYAYLVWAMIELYQATQDPAWLAEAVRLQQEQDALFWDSEHSGYFFYADDSEHLIARPKQAYDGALPSGNSVSAQNLLRLSRLLAEPRYTGTAMSLLEAMGGQVKQQPSAYTQLLQAVISTHIRTKDIVVVASADEAKDITRLLSSVYEPEALFAIRTPANHAELELLVPHTIGLPTKASPPEFHICEGDRCTLATTDTNEVLSRLRA